MSSLKPAAVCAIQHVECEDLGLIADVLQVNGIRVDCLRPFAGDKVPVRLGDYAGLVVMGGPMGAKEQDDYPFLRREVQLIRDAVQPTNGGRARPVLGICLGSQLLALALGGSVRPNRQKEIGWHGVTLEPMAAADPLFTGLGPTFTGYHWHGDVFALPDGAVSLARSDLTECQAFRAGPSAYGILCHLEVTPDTIRRMVRTFRGDLLEAGLAGSEVLHGVAQHLSNLHRIGSTVFQRWAGLVKGRGAQFSAAQPAAALW